MKKIKRDDEVIVTTGKDKGKRGKVLKVQDDGRVIVSGINMMKKHTKPTQRDPQGGIIEREAPLHVSNVMLVDPKNDEPTRVGRQRLDEGRRVRVAKRSGEMIDS